MKSLNHKAKKLKPKKKSTCYISLKSNKKLPIFFNVRIFFLIFFSFIYYYLSIMSTKINDPEQVVKDKNVIRSKSTISLVTNALLLRLLASVSKGEKVKLTEDHIVTILPHVMNHISQIPNLKGYVRRDILISSLKTALDVYHEKLPSDDNVEALKKWIDSKEFSDIVEEEYKKRSTGSRLRQGLLRDYKNRKKLTRDIVADKIDLTQMLITDYDITNNCIGKSHDSKNYINAKIKRMLKWISKNAEKSLQNIKIEDEVVSLTERSNVRTLDLDKSYSTKKHRESLKKLMNQIKLLDTSLFKGKLSTHEVREIVKQKLKHAPTPTVNHLLSLTEYLEWEKSVVLKEKEKMKKKLKDEEDLKVKKEQVKKLPPKRRITPTSTKSKNTHTNKAQHKPSHIRAATKPLQTVKRGRREKAIAPTSTKSVMVR